MDCHKFLTVIVHRQFCNCSESSLRVALGLHSHLTWLVSTDNPLTLTHLCHSPSQAIPLPGNRLLESGIWLKMQQVTVVEEEDGESYWQHVGLCIQQLFLQRGSTAERCINYDRFCLTVWPSVTRWYHVKTTPATIMGSSLEDSPMTLASSWLTSVTTKFQRKHRERGRRMREG